MSKKNYSVARVVTHTQSTIGKCERHNERKNESYANMNVDTARCDMNVHFKGCGELTYNEQLNKLIAEKRVCMRGLKADAKVFDEMIFDVNTDYFETHGGYEYAKKFYAEAYRFAVNLYGEQNIISAVMHADELNVALTEQYGKHPSFKRPVWLCDLGDEYSFERISQKLYADWRHYRIDLPPQDEWKDYLYDFERNYKEVYVHFVTVVQAVKSRPKENYYIEKYLQREIIKLDRLIEQQNLLCHYDIETDEQLQAFKQECINEMAEVTEARRIYRNKLKSAVRKGDEKEIAEIKDTISLFSERLKILRKDINTCERIENSEPEIENKIGTILEIEQQQKNKTQNRNRGYSRDER